MLDPVLQESIKSNRRFVEISAKFVNLASFALSIRELSEFCEICCKKVGVQLGSKDWYDLTRIAWISRDLLLGRRIERFSRNLL